MESTILVSLDSIVEPLNYMAVNAEEPNRDDK